MSLGRRQRDRRVIRRVPSPAIAPGTVGVEQLARALGELVDRVNELVDIVQTNLDNGNLE